MKRRATVILALVVAGLLALDAAMLFFALRGNVSVVLLVFVAAILFSFGANGIPYLMLRRYGVKFTAPCQAGRAYLTRTLDALERTDAAEDVRAALRVARVAKWLWVFQIVASVVAWSLAAGMATPQGSP